ncbi:MAG: serine/threonine-protein kinase [Gemmatimonadaceae bacterium]
MTDQFDETFLAVQSVLVGEYSLERELGRGGMGIVYLAREVSLDRLVAIKVLPPHLGANPDLRQRFLREAQTAARLSHPNIVPIFRVGEAGEFVYFAMAYVEGETLTERVRTKGPLTPVEGARILREAAWALAYAHARNIVHRDVKPDNILLERGTLRAMLTDFGIAHVETPSPLTDAGLVMGTAQYMSPEQAAGERVDGRSDLYSLGIVAHFMLAGKVPFDEKSVAALLAKHLTQPAPPLTSVAPGVPRKLGEAIDHCLAKSPEQRFHSGEALAEALTVATEPTREVPAPIRVWLTKSQQNRGARAFFAVYLSLATIGLAVESPWFGVMPIVIIAAGLGIPALWRTRRVLKAGYSLEDLRAALRIYWAQRQEEAAYEVSETSAVTSRVAFAISGIGMITAAGAYAFGTPGPLREGLIGGALVIGAITGGLGLVDLLMRPFRGRVGWMSLKFWNGRWAEKFVALAKTGLKRVAVAPATPQLTEIALGRATDALFQALPSALRRDLKELPDTVRRLETDARKLRDQIDVLERQLATFAPEDRMSSSRSIAASAPQDRSIADSRARVAAELSSTRAAARTRLADTVAALENLRLGLLRLQMGSAPVESVTATIQAALRVADDVRRVGAAEAEVEAALRIGTSPPMPGNSRG